MTIRIQGRSVADGNIGNVTDFTQIEADEGRIFETVDNNNLSTWIVESSQKDGGKLISGSLYANPLSLSESIPKPISSLPFGINQIEGFINGSLNCVRSTQATYFDIYGKLRISPPNELRVENDGALIEGPSTNYLYPYDSPSTQSRTIPSGDYTLSVYGSGSASTIYGTATEGSPVTFNSGGETLTVTVSGLLDYFQLEPLAFATSLIPTVSSSATRAADNVTIPSLDNYIGVFQGNYTILFDFKSKGGSGRVFTAVAESGSQNLYQAFNDGNKINFINGTASAAFGVNTNMLEVNKFAGVHSNGVSILYTNGIASNENTSSPSSNLDTSINLTIGSRPGAGSGNVYGYIKNFEVYNLSLPISQIKSIQGV